MADKFFFHSKSARALPGKGKHEEASAAYPMLEVTPAWREMLSNFWESPFVFTDGHKYKTVEHVFQAKKIYIPFEKVGVSFADSPAFRFTLDSEDPLGKADGLAARKQRKMVVLSGTDIATWSQRSEACMEEAQRCKFSQNPMLQRVLLGTGEAELWHGAARMPPVRMLSLERVRSTLQSTSSTLGPGSAAAESPAPA